MSLRQKLDDLLFTGPPCLIVIYYRLRAYFHYGCALRCVASDSQR